MSEKLQKVLARAGFGSRRQLEQWIQAGRITIDGQIAKLGDRVSFDAKILVDGKPVTIKKASDIKTRVLIYHKAAGEMCTRSDPEGRPTIFENLPSLQMGRWLSVGRLDFNTLGLLLITNDGELANKLMHPNFAIEREYAVRVLGEIDDSMISRLQRGIKLEDGLGRFQSIQYVGGEGINHWYHVVVTEGRNRLVRRLWESQGVTVSRLIRVRYHNILLPRSLRAKYWRELDKETVDGLISTTHSRENKKYSNDD